jgi:thioredoxin 2
VITILDFWSPTCGYCKQLSPALVEFARNNQHAVQPVSINTALPHNKAAVNEYGVRKVPTLVLIKDGREVARSQGIQPPTADAIRRWVGAHEPSVR